MPPREILDKYPCVTPWYSFVVNTPLLQDKETRVQRGNTDTAIKELVKTLQELTTLLLTYPRAADSESSHV